MKKKVLGAWKGLPAQGSEGRRESRAFIPTQGARRPVWEDRLILRRCGGAAAWDSGQTGVLDRARLETTALGCSSCF